jgi:hypothetical protein
MELHKLRCQEADQKVTSFRRRALTVNTFCIKNSLSLVARNYQRSFRNEEDRREDGDLNQRSKRMENAKDFGDESKVISENGARQVFQEKKGSREA